MSETRTREVAGPELDETGGGRGPVRAAAVRPVARLHRRGGHHPAGRLARGRRGGGGALRRRERPAGRRACSPAPRTPPSSPRRCGRCWRSRPGRRWRRVRRSRCSAAPTPSGTSGDLDDTLLQKPRRHAWEPRWPWAIWYPLRRAGAFAALPEAEQQAMLKEHGTLGMGFARGDAAHDVRPRLPRPRYAGQRLRDRPSWARS